MKRLTVPVVEQFIADLKDAVREAYLTPSGKGTMVTLYGKLTSYSMLTCWVERLLMDSLTPVCVSDPQSSLPGLGKSSAVGPTMVRHVATAFIDTLYKA